MQIVIGVGSNKGKRLRNIQQAAEQLTADTSIRIIAEAQPFENPAQGGPSKQGPFINTAWIIETALGPHQVLHRLQIIERNLGRVRTVVHGARSIDLDLLMTQDGQVIENVVLSLPHPRMHERDFVMIPVAEIAPDWMHPILKKSMIHIRDSYQSSPDA